LSLEAFFLSNQSTQLYNTSILPALPSKANQTLLSSSSPIDPGQLAQVQLSGEVLLQSKQSSVVDALLLAVPAPIQALTSTSTPDFEHSFPSPLELNDNRLQAIARKHVLKILGSSAANQAHTIINRLRDPHLLVYLSNILDESSHAALCKALIAADTSHRLPGNVVAALDLVRMLLTSD
jgi:hypothetical protein